VDFGKQTPVAVKGFTEPAQVDTFVSFTERIPGTTVQFDMVAIPGGTFVMGSPENEPFRKPDEGPQHTVHVRPFFMGKVVVSWDEYLAFITQTGGAGHGTQQEKGVDGISGPTPPWAILTRDGQGNPAGHHLDMAGAMLIANGNKSHRKKLPCDRAD
jgi:formylglycine-generating enzyme required for sulfatase activity